MKRNIIENLKNKRTLYRMDDDDFQNYTLRKRKKINFTIEEEDYCLKSGKAASKSLVTKAKEDMTPIKLSKHNTSTVLPPEEAHKKIRERVGKLLAENLL